MRHLSKDDGDRVVKRKQPPGGNVDTLATDIERVAAALAQLYATPLDLFNALVPIAASADPWRDLVARREATAVAARLAAVSEVVLGLLGRHDRLLADDELSRGLVARGYLGGAQ